MSAQRAALVIEPAPDVCQLLRVVLEEDGYAVESTPDATRGLQVLRASTLPMTVLFDVMPLPDLPHEKSGLAILDAIAQDAAQGDHLTHHGYVLMSTDVERALATVETVPASLQILPKPFRLEELHASLRIVDAWLRAHALSRAFTSTGGVARAQAAIKASRDLLAEALARLKSATEPTAGRNADTDVNGPH